MGDTTIGIVVFRSPKNWRLIHDLPVEALGYKLVQSLLHTGYDVLLLSKKLTAFPKILFF